MPERQELCHCGKPLHYTNPFAEQQMRVIIQRKGEYCRITTGGRTWLVQRHYVALHGIRAVDLPTLGFQEITEDEGGSDANRRTG